jgi:outer membrane protein OmpA-like peptidoglycan-associated protein
MITLMAGIAACSSTPDVNNQLEQARADFERAQSSPQVTTLAADELKQAGDALRLTESAWKEREEEARINHLAYMTIQRVTIAQEIANNRAAQEITASAAAERDKMRLALRTNEADAAAAQVSDLEMQLQELNARKTERGIVVTLGDVLFDTGKSALRAGGTNNMAKLAEVMKNSPETTALIEGHTDSVGSASSNYSLSQRRADAVRDALVNLGVANDRLSTRAHGADMPAADNDSASGRQMNRRVEIVFTE